MTSRDELLKRPSFEQAEKTYKALIMEVVKAVKSTAPEIAWDAEPIQSGMSACARPLDTIDDASSAGYLIGGRGAVPDSKWRALTDLVYEVVKKHGYTRRATIDDRPGSHYEAYYGPYDEEFSISAQASTSMGINGACFLEASAGPTK